MEIGENKNLTYIGTFDGYDSDVASSKCLSQLHLALLSTLHKSNIGIEFAKDKFDAYDEINHLNKYELQQEEFSTAQSENSSHNDFNENHSDDENFRLKCFKKAFKHAYRCMDKLLARGKDEKSLKRWSGATACTCIIDNNSLNNNNNNSDGWIHIANCGTMS